LTSPSSWSVSETDHAIEIVNAQAQGVLHLSLLKRTRADAAGESDARLLLVENFALNSGLVPDGPLSSTMQEREARVMGAFRPNTPTNGTPMHWLLASVVWHDRTVRASYCTDSVSAESLQLATGSMEAFVAEVHSARRQTLLMLCGFPDSITPARETSTPPASPPLPTDNFARITMVLDMDKLVKWNAHLRDVGSIGKDLQAIVGMQRRGAIISSSALSGAQQFFMNTWAWLIRELWVSSCLGFPPQGAKLTSGYGSSWATYRQPI
jgi:hypothetical protein